MDETLSVPVASLASQLAGMTSGDKAFLGLIASLVAAYLGKRYFDTVEKAMNHGYDATISSEKHGTMSFSHGNGNLETNADDESAVTPTTAV